MAPATKSLRTKPGNGKAKEVDAKELPPGRPYTTHGTGTFRVLAGSGPIIGRGYVRRYVVEVERGITGVDLAAFSRQVQTTLADRRGWTAGDAVALQRVTDPAHADFAVSLTSSLTVRGLCGYEQKIETSCWENSHGASRVHLNVARWVRGNTSFRHDLLSYHQYTINHEVGHALGHAHTYHCLPTGLAPVMLQQTITSKKTWAMAREPVSRTPGLTRRARSEGPGLDERCPGDIWRAIMSRCTRPRPAT